jgi:hypothetical protein
LGVFHDPSAEKNVNKFSEKVQFHEKYAYSLMF